jgi:hypothetical protein
MSLPDWLVERAALDEVPPASRDRVAAADPGELARRVAALRDDNAAELARFPAGPAVAELEARVAAERRRRRRDRWRRWAGGLALATCAAAALVVLRPGAQQPVPDQVPDEVDATQGATPNESTRPKGNPRLLAFRHVGEQVEQLKQDATVRAGDVIQLRYNSAGQSYGVIASVDGAGVVTLHYPLRDDAPPQATAMAEKAALPNAYSLDDAPRFERFFFVTASGPIDVQRTLAALRALGQRTDSETALLELPEGMRQSSLRLRKPDPSSNHESP